MCYYFKRLADKCTQLKNVPPVRGLSYDISSLIYNQNNFSAILQII